MFPVTEREVINGILNVKNTKNHCLAYLRYINNINLQNLKKASLYLDILNRSLDTEASKLLANLRDERVPGKIETTNLQRWDCCLRFAVWGLPFEVCDGLACYGFFFSGTPWNGSDEKVWTQRHTKSTFSILSRISIKTLPNWWTEPWGRRTLVRRDRLWLKYCSICMPAIILSRWGAFCILMSSVFEARAYWTFLAGILRQRRTSNQNRELHEEWLW